MLEEFVRNTWCDVPLELKVKIPKTQDRLGIDVLVPLAELIDTLMGFTFDEALFSLIARSYTKRYIYIYHFASNLQILNKAIYSFTSRAFIL